MKDLVLLDNVKIEHIKVLEKFNKALYGGKFTKIKHIGTKSEYNIKELIEEYKMKRTIQLVERTEKGRIKKNESYTIEDITKVITDDLEITLENISWWDRVFDWKATSTSIKNIVEEDFVHKINIKIDLDNDSIKKTKTVKKKVTKK